MKTVGEIDAEGRLLRIFHRTDTAAWTHAPGERYSFRSSDRHLSRGTAGRMVEMACDCPYSHGVAARSDAVAVVEPPGVAEALEEVAGA
jgi:hypothetical protein